MQVVAKKPHIDIHIEGKGIKSFLKIIQKSIPDVQIIDDEYVDIDNSQWHKDIKSKITAGDILKIRRENIGFTQAELAEKCGIASSNIALMENGKRNIGAKSAKKLAEALHCEAGDFII